MSAFVRCRSRRRGQDLVRDLHRAALEEVADVGFDAMTFEKVAARAGAGKASVYKRWSTPAELLLEAVEETDAEVLGRMEARPGSLRDELFAIHRGFAEGVETVAGRALLSLIAVRHQYPDFWDRILALMVVPRQALVYEAVQRAVADG